MENCAARSPIVNMPRRSSGYRFGVGDFVNVTRTILVGERVNVIVIRTICVGDRVGVAVFLAVGVLLGVCVCVGVILL